MKINHIVMLGAVLALCSPALAQTQRMAVPAYFYPGATWTQMEAGAPTVAIAVMNPASGPGNAVNTEYQTQVKAAQADGIKVVCYVDTAYAKKDINVVKSQIHNAFDWYHVDGILLDEVTSDADHVGFYVTCHDYIKSLQPKAMVLLNPGTQVDEGYMKAGDVICTFESQYSDYQNNYSAPAWVANYPAQRFWHIIFNVPTSDEATAVVAESKKRHAGWVFITSATLPNPYDVLPAQDYWWAVIYALKTP